MTTPRQTFRRGDVVLVLFPHSNLQAAKTRPALVVQRNDLGTGIPQLVVAMITSNLSRTGHPRRVAVALSTPQGQQSGLLTDSVVVTDNLATVALPAIDRIIGSLARPDVDDALRHTLDL